MKGIQCRKLSRGKVSDRGKGVTPRKGPSGVFEIKHEE